MRVRTEQLADANTTLTNQARELEAMNDRLRENDLYKSHFFTMMSHELRTPITAIRAYVDILDDVDEIDVRPGTMPSTPPDRTPKALTKLVDNILDSARIEARSGQGRNGCRRRQRRHERAGKDFGLPWRWTKASR